MSTPSDFYKLLTQISNHPDFWDCGLRLIMTITSHNFHVADSGDVEDAREEFNEVCYELFNKLPLRHLFEEDDFITLITKQLKVSKSKKPRGTPEEEEEKRRATALKAAATRKANAEKRKLEAQMTQTLETEVVQSQSSINEMSTMTDTPGSKVSVSEIGTMTDSSSIMPSVGEMNTSNSKSSVLKVSIGIQTEEEQVNIFAPITPPLPLVEPPVTKISVGTQTSDLNEPSLVENDLDKYFPYGRITEGMSKEEMAQIFDAKYKETLSKPPPKQFPQELSDYEEKRKGVSELQLQYEKHYDHQLFNKILLFLNHGYYSVAGDLISRYLPAINNVMESRIEYIALKKYAVLKYLRSVRAMRKKLHEVLFKRS